MGEMQLVWGWQPALYLFLGGVGAGAFLVAGVLLFVDRQQHRNIAGASMWGAVGCLGIGLLLLLSELTNPARGLLLWQSFSNSASWMTFGAWAAFLALLFFVVSALVVTRKTGAFIIKKWPAFASYEHSVVTEFVSIGMALAVCVAVYTGMLLMAVPGVPLWNTLLLPCLFTVSAFDTGIALVEIISIALKKHEQLIHTGRRLLEKSSIVLILLEGLILALFIRIMLAGNITNATIIGSSAATAVASMRMLVAGSLAPYFWGLLVGCGLVVPFIVSSCCLMMKRKSFQKTKERLRTKFIISIGAVGALAGGCALRFLILLAGVHADLVMDTVAQLLL